MNFTWFSNQSNELAPDLFDGPPHPTAPHPDGPPRSLTSNVTSPHDNVLAGIHGQIMDASENNNADSVKARVLRNPYDGSAIGDAHFSDSVNHIDVKIKQPLPSNTEELIWQQLSKVLDLQAQVASQHLQMEGIGAKVTDGKVKSKGGQSQANLWEAMSSRDGLVADNSRPGGKDEDVELSAEAEEEKRNRQREEEFAKLALQFNGRKEGIAKIMDQVRSTCLV